MGGDGDDTSVVAGASVKREQGAVDDSGSAASAKKKAKVEAKTDNDEADSSIDQKKDSLPKNNRKVKGEFQEDKFEVGTPVMIIGLPSILEEEISPTERNKVQFTMKGKVKEFDQVGGHYIVEFNARECFSKEKKYNHLLSWKPNFTGKMTAEEIRKNPYRIWTEHFFDTFVWTDHYTHATRPSKFDLKAINWDKFLEDLNQVPEIANLSVSGMGAPPFVFAMLSPTVTFDVIERLLEINPAAANFGNKYDGGWMAMIASYGDYGGETSEFLSKIDLKILRLILETSTDPMVALRGIFANDYVPIDRFVDVDTENLTPATRLVLELSPYANIHVLNRHFSNDEFRKFKLGDPALKFCTDLVMNNVGEKYIEKDRDAVQKMMDRNADSK